MKTDFFYQFFDYTVTLLQKLDFLEPETLESSKSFHINIEYVFELSNNVLKGNELYKLVDDKLTCHLPKAFQFTIARDSYSFIEILSNNEKEQNLYLSIYQLASPLLLLNSVFSVFCLGYQNKNSKNFLIFSKNKADLMKIYNYVLSENLFCYGICTFNWLEQNKFEIKSFPYALSWDYGRFKSRDTFNKVPNSNLLVEQLYFESKVITVDKVVFLEDFQNKINYNLVEVNSFDAINRLSKLIRWQELIEPLGLQKENFIFLTHFFKTIKAYEIQYLINFNEAQFLNQLDKE